MAHRQSLTSKNWLSWLRTTASNLQMQVSNYNASNINPNAYSLMQARSTDMSSNQFITIREADILTEQVNSSSDVISVSAIGGNPVYFFVKRIIDVAMAIILVLLSLPVFMICSLFVAIDNTGSIFGRKQEFTSQLVKHDDQYVWIIMPFTRYEFLTTGAVTGQFLQATGLNALPALMNVFLGDMSIIGTETLTQEDIERFEDWQFLSFACKPGIIGLSRISGKISWLANDNIRQEIWYACNQSLSVDFKILFRTIRSVMAIL